jgi:hypothetical protein
LMTFSVPPPAVLVIVQVDVVVEAMVPEQPLYDTV